MEYYQNTEQTASSYSIAIQNALKIAAPIRGRYNFWCINGTYNSSRQIFVKQQE